MKETEVNGMLCIDDKMYLAKITLRTEHTGDHATLSLAEDIGGVMLHISCDDYVVKEMLKEVSE